MPAVSAGWLICLPTPYGKRGFFYDAWAEQAYPCFLRGVLVNSRGSGISVFARVQGCRSGGKDREGWANDKEKQWGSAPMFESASALGTMERSIPLATGKGTFIANVVGPKQLDVYTVNKEAVFVRAYGQNWTRRKSAVGIYNCAGMIWGCRRTAIYEPELFN
jgi:hypothetical protein